MQNGVTHKGCDPANATVVPIRPPVSICREPRLYIYMANEAHIAHALGSDVADRMRTKLFDMIERGFGDCATMSRCESGVLEMRIVDVGSLGFSEGSLAEGCRDLLISLRAAIAQASLEIDSYSLKAVLAGAWQLPGDQVKSTAEIFSGDLRGGLFSGDPPGGGVDWVERYLDDLLLAGEFLSGSGLEVPDGNGGWASVQWRAVRRRGNCSQTLFHDLVCGMRTASGESFDAGAHLAALERLGFAGMISRLLALRAIDELSASPGLVLCIRISPRAACVGGDLFAALDASLRCRPGVAQRLVVEIVGDGAGLGEAGLGSFCDAIRRLGCSIAFGDFGAGARSVRDLIAFRPDIVRLDPFLVRHTRRILGSRGEQVLGHLVGLATSLSARVVADGVDSEDCAAVLGNMGVEWQQGELWGVAGTVRPWRIAAGWASAYVQAERLADIAGGSRVEAKSC